MGMGLFQFPLLKLGSRALVKTMPSGRTQKTSTTPGEWETAATPLRGSAEPGLAAMGMGLFQFPLLKLGSRALVKTMPSGRIQNTSTAFGSLDRENEDPVLCLKGVRGKGLSGFGPDIIVVPGKKLSSSCLKNGNGSLLSLVRF